MSCGAPFACRRAVPAYFSGPYSILFRTGAVFSSSSPSALLIQPSKLGDVVLTAALLDDLHAAVPNIAVDFLVGNAAEPLLREHPLIRRRILYPGTWSTTLREIRRAHYDLVVDPRSSTRTALFAWLSRAAVRVGFDVRPPRVWAYTHRVRRDAEAIYAPNDRRRLLSAVGIPTLRTRPKLFVSPAERTLARNHLMAHGVDPARPIIGIMLSAGVVRKEWSPAHWAAVTAALAGDGVQLVVFTAPNDEEKVAMFRAAGGIGVEIPCRLRELLALLTFCSVFTSGDTGPSHFAMALAVPTVTLYSKGIAPYWNPGDPDTIALAPDPSMHCSACGLPRKQRDSARHECMQSIAEADVLDRLRALIALAH